jgi:hypothetical protein
LPHRETARAATGEDCSDTIGSSRLKESWKVKLVLMPSVMMPIVVPVLYDSFLAAIAVMVGMFAGIGLVSSSYTKER